jgi:hypothetical protein
MPDHLSYDNVLAILQDTGRITGTMASFPTTNDALLRMDCAIRTHLSQTAVRIHVMNRPGSTFLCDASVWIQMRLSGTGLS